MSNDTSNTPKSGELFGGDAAGMRAYRFEFRHALVFPAVLLLFIALAGAVLSLARFSVEIFGHDAALDSIAFVDERQAYRPVPERVFERDSDRAPDLWERARRDERKRLATARDLLRETQRTTQAERALTEVFAAVDRSDPRQMRKFLAAYKNDPVAQELGYIDAVQRAVSERRLFRSDEIVACDQCWCLREGPASVNEGQTTQ